MADVLIEESTMDEIADAIRAKNKSATTYLPSQMSNAITNLPEGAQLSLKHWDSECFSLAQYFSGSIVGDTITIEGTENISITILTLDVKVNSLPSQPNVRMTLANSINDELSLILANSYGQNFQAFTYYQCTPVVQCMYASNLQVQFWLNPATNQSIRGQLILYGVHDNA
jgi:hypothetical protein